MDKKHAGAHNELLATVWLLANGYEVFRNVSQHGAVDIVAIKDGEISLFDVKKTRRDAQGQVMFRLNAEQVKMGIKMLAVYENGECEIVSYNPREPIERHCKGCGREFKARIQGQLFCTNPCSAKFFSDKYKKKLETGALA